MRISDIGLELVKHFEGLHLTAYIDPVGIWTIGYGHIGPDDAFSGNTISEQRAEELLREDLEEAERAVGKFISVDLDWREFDALTSFTFNVGSGALSKSTLRRKLNEGDRDGAADEFPRWNKGTIGGKKVELKGLTRRRKAERHLFKTGELNFFDGHGVVDPDTPEAPPSGTSQPGSVPASAAAQPDLEFADLVKSWGLKHFRPSEILFMGDSHSKPGSPGFGLNTVPPRHLWDKIEPTMRVLDKLRATLNAPITLSSVYRSPDYNKAVGGVSNSLHKEFCAVDFKASTTSGPEHWAATLRDIRSHGDFVGGIGTYKTFVHLDTRGTDVDF